MQIIIIAPQGAGKVAVAEKIRAALGDQFNSSVQQVPHRSRYLEARRLPFRLITKPHALYPT